MNDFAIIHNKVSEFLYKPITEKLEGLGLRREVFRELAQNKFWKRTLKLYRLVFSKYRKDQLRSRYEHIIISRYYNIQILNIVMLS